MRLVVSDSGPIIHLHEAGALHLLEHAGRIAIPPVVDAEIAVYVPRWTELRPSWMRVTPLAGSNAEDAEAWHAGGLLDTGESAAIALARQEQAEWILTDDTAARIFAESLRLEAHGSLGFVLWAVATGHLSKNDGLTTLARLADSSLWISARVMGEAVGAINRMT